MIFVSTSVCYARWNYCIFVHIYPMVGIGPPHPDIQQSIYRQHLWMKGNDYVRRRSYHGDVQIRLVYIQNLVFAQDMLSASECNICPTLNRTKTARTLVLVRFSRE